MSYRGRCLTANFRGTNPFPCAPSQKNARRAGIAIAAAQLAPPPKKSLRSDALSLYKNMDAAAIGLAGFDPFAGLGGNQQATPAGPKEKIHVRMNKQGRRFVTLIEGLDDDLDQARIARAMKKAFSCASKVQKDKHDNEVIFLQGDHRMKVKEWLLFQEILTPKEAEERLMLHGY